VAQTQAAAGAEPSNQPQASDSGATAAVPKPDESGEAAAGQPAPSVTPPKVRAQRATASAAGIGDLEAEGEKYLYGNGVPENCARARRNLMAAAQRSNAKAENVLGTMYATGHCAKRDLPTAYRWFGRSLQKDPGNTRIQEDLKVLWNQMTPEEQKLALRGER
jgi:TPR repeat protein